MTTTRLIGDDGVDGYHSLSVVADADGNSFAGVMATEPKRFATYVYLPPSSAAPRWIVLVLESQAFSPGGYLVGTVEQPMPLAHGRYTSGYHGYAVGDLGVLDISNGVSVLDFDSGTQLYSITGNSLPMSFEWMFASSVFWQGDSSRVADVGRWDPDAGAVDFINYGFDPNHASGSLGTDGVNMVWIEAHGPASDAGFWTTADFWTSPFVTNNSELVPRRLRSAPVEALGSTHVAVGCGYAATSANTAAWIVRVSDGWGWALPDVTGWTWQVPLAISCTDVFFQVVSTNVNTVARVPLNQLGPGIAPD